MKKELLKYVVVFITLITLFVGYAVLVSLLPTEKIKKHIETSANELLDDGDYPNAIMRKSQYQMDNFTDGLILSINYTIDNKKPFNSAMLCTWSTGKAGSNMTESLWQQSHDEDVGFVNYPRYWHGNSFLIRPFLLFTNYETIRWIMYALSSILMLILGIKLFQKLGMLKTIAFATGLICVNIFVTQFSIQFFPVVVMSVIASILMCKYYDNRKKVLLTAFILGCCTAYFDLFTTPLLICGLPLIVYISLKTDEPFIRRLKTVLLFSCLWAFAYALCWMTKLTLATLLSDMNVFANAFDQFVGWSDTQKIARIDAITRTFGMLPIFFICLALSVLFLLTIFFFNKKEIKTNILLFIVALYPFVWFFLAALPSYWHWWFSYRAYAISIIALFFIFINFISWDKVEKLITK